MESQLLQAHPRQGTYLLTRIFLSENVRSDPCITLPSNPWMGKLPKLWPNSAFRKRDFSILPLRRGEKGAIMAVFRVLTPSGLFGPKGSAHSASSTIKETR